jgi:putative phosphoribosyl transferase
VAAKATLKQLRREADHVVSVQAPADFGAVGEYYLRFPQLRDQEVIELLEQARVFAASTNPARSQT